MRSLPHIYCETLLPDRLKIQDHRVQYYHYNCMLVSKLWYQYLKNNVLPSLFCKVIDQDYLVDTVVNNNSRLDYEIISINTGFINYNHKQLLLDNSKIKDQLYQVTSRCKQVLLQYSRIEIKEGLEFRGLFPNVVKVVVDHQSKELLESLSVLVRDYNLRYIKFKKICTPSTISATTTARYQSFKQFYQSVNGYLKKLAIKFPVDYWQEELKVIDKCDYHRFEHFTKDSNDLGTKLNIDICGWIDHGSDQFTQQFIENSKGARITKLLVNRQSEPLKLFINQHPELKSLKFRHVKMLDTQHQIISEMAISSSRLKQLEINCHLVGSSYILVCPNLEKICLKSIDYDSLQNVKIIPHFSAIKNYGFPLRELSIPNIFCYSKETVNSISSLLESCIHLEVLSLNIFVNKYKDEINFMPILTAIEKSFKHAPLSVTSNRRLVLSLFLQHSTIQGQSCPSGQYQCGNTCYNPSNQKCINMGSGSYLICASNEYQCGNQCYNPSTQKCINLVGTSGYLICGSNEYNCGNQCYNPSTQKCINLGGTSGYLICNSTQYQCGNTCYEPATQKCINLGGTSGYLICGSNEYNCGNQCYNPNTQKCISSSSGSYYICGSNDGLCGTTCYNLQSQKCNQPGNIICSSSEYLCGSQCYDPSTKKCITGSTGGYYICGSNDGLCNGTCYNLSTQKCISGTYICGSNDGICGTTCYNLQSQKCNQPGNIICSSSEYLCGSQCYNPNTQKCINLGGTSGYLICSSNEYQCGNTCYNPSTQKCINLGGTSGYLICASNEYQCGNKCYNPSTQKCINMGSNGYLICSSNEYQCGNTCYNPSTQKCINLGSSYLICASNEYQCGNQCYNPSTQKCINLGSSYLICSSNEYQCGNQCYNPSTQKCYNSGSSYIICNSNQSLCGTTCC
eukprot:gene8081-9943_t